MAKRPPKPNDPPAPRNIAREQALAAAIDSFSVVEVKYENDMLWRTYEPHCVFYGTADQRQVRVFGDQIRNGNKPADAPAPRDFEVGLIIDLRATGAKFKRPSTFDRFASKFKHGIIRSL